ncbi:MAG: PEP-utilizing enzyme [Candidatus Paceibacterota bacterium]
MYPNIFNEENELFRWGPIPGRYFNNSDFVETLFPHLPAPYENVSWPHSLFMFKNKQMVWINDFAELRKWGKEIFKKYMLSETIRYPIKEHWDKELVVKLREAGQAIGRTDLNKLQDDDLLSCWNNFLSALENFWVPTLLWEGGNYGSDRFLEDELRKYITNVDEWRDAMEILTTPEQLSFFQQEEIDLSETDNIELHQNKFFWLKNSYGGTQILPIDFFIARKEHLEKNLRQHFLNKIIEIKKKKFEIQRKYILPKEVMSIATALCDGIVWQDERKKNIFQVLHYKNLVLEEVSRRRQISPDDLRNCGCRELSDIIRGKDFTSVLASRKEYFGIYYADTKTQILSSDETKYYWKKYAEEEVQISVTSVSGIVASKGNDKIVRGKVRILLDPYDTGSINDGEVLVAPMTSPEYVFAMKKASAIVTDTGGLTSHAAIVSRELHKSCIVGTKIATKVLKDGDMVEVDAERGTVRIVK